MTETMAAFRVAPGVEVTHNGSKAIVTHVVSLNAVLVRMLSTGLSMQVPIVELEPVNIVKRSPPLEKFHTEDLAIAEQRLECIKPLIDLPGRKRRDVLLQAEKTNVSVNTLYKWLTVYENSRLLTSLLPKERKDKGIIKMPPEVEAIISATIRDEYLNKQRKSAKKVADEVRRRCKNAGLSLPHENTIRNRINALADELKVSKRLGKKIARDMFEPNRGSFPGADWPLSVIQIDHTKLDIILVDDHHRRPVGRPWITLAMDVFSRTVYGFYISLDPPGAASTGLCLAHAILPKENWLLQRSIESEWPLWGLPKTLHMDNAREFRGSMLETACKQYGIEIEWRPVARPNYGGHIERLLGTFSKEIHSLPGTTFSNTKMRGMYKSDELAALTLSEFEKWLSIYITEVYHNKKHSTIGMTPLEKLREGIFGTDNRPGVGLPPRISDSERLLLDFMPYEKRTVQDYGVVIDKVHYWSNVLRPWVNAKNPDNAKLRREFIFRRDPRDISRIWFYDPDLSTYFEIPYRNTSHPAVSIWEFREAKKRAEDTTADVDEAKIFAAYERMQEIEDNAKRETKARRRAEQRRGMGIGAMEKTLGGRREPGEVKIVEREPTNKVVQPFDELDDLAGEE